MVKLSKRLMAVASMVCQDQILADVGTDHGYIPIYLMEQGRITGAIAMDIGKGPLERAKEHIKMSGMGDYIQTRLSDGLAALHVGEVQSIVVAGMGGGLVIHILEEGRKVAQAVEEVILQPQSELEKVRDYLRENGYTVEAEDMVFEDGKYYPMMRVRYTGKVTEDKRITALREQMKEQMHLDEAQIEGIFARYGAGLLAEKNATLFAYLQKEQHTYQVILENLKGQPSSANILERQKEMQEKMLQNEQAGSLFERNEG